MAQNAPMKPWAACATGMAMVEVLLEASASSACALSRADLLATPRSVVGLGGRNKGKRC